LPKRLRIDQSVRERARNVRARRRNPATDHVVVASEVERRAVVDDPRCLSGP
jgi:hypothetical protein